VQQRPAGGDGKLFDGPVATVHQLYGDTVHLVLAPLLLLTILSGWLAARNIFVSQTTAVILHCEVLKRHVARLLWNTHGPSLFGLRTIKMGGSAPARESDAVRANRFSYIQTGARKPWRLGALAGCICSFSR